MLDKLQSFIEDTGFERTYWLAYSGGLDSRVLLQLCAELRKRRPFILRAIHVHHGLSPQADRWTAHCRESCEKLEVEFHCLRIDARTPPGESLEAYAREKRYTALQEALSPGDVLLTAHHQDDQAETVLLQLLRGAGPKGLSAMPRLKSLGKGWLGRPLLGVARAELRAYAEEQALSWVEDELNQDLDYPRNRLRREGLPWIKTHWPTAAKTLARSAEQCAEAQTLLEEFADSDLARLAGSKPRTLSVKRLLELSPPRQRLILRRWFESQGALMPSAVKLSQLQQDVLQSSEDSQPCVSWGEVDLRRYQDDLYLIRPLEAHDPGSAYDWDFNAPLLIPGIGKLQAQLDVGRGLRRTLQPVEVRFRQGGEVYRLPDGHHHELKKFFQEQGIPPWERDRLPLIYAGGELAAVPGYFVVEAFKTAKEENGWAVEWFKI